MIATKREKHKTNRQRKAAEALARSSIYRLLALLFNYPTAENIDSILEALPLASDAAQLLGQEISNGIVSVEQYISAASKEQIEEERLQVFAHVMTSDCHPCETAYLAAHLFQQGSILADVSGFYRAFGVEPQGERADHIAVELEFLALLTFKESYALLNRKPQRAAICRSATRQFLEEHLGAWAPVLASNIVKKAGGGVMAASAKLLDSFVKNDIERLRARPISPKTLVPIRQTSERQDDDECGPAPIEGVPSETLSSGHEVGVINHETTLQ